MSTATANTTTTYVVVTKGKAVFGPSMVLESYEGGDETGIAISRGNSEAVKAEVGKGTGEIENMTLLVRGGAHVILRNVVIENCIPYFNVEDETSLLVIKSCTFVRTTITVAKKSTVVCADVTVKEILAAHVYGRKGETNFYFGPKGKLKDRYALATPDFPFAILSSHQKDGERAVRTVPVRDDPAKAVVCVIVNRTRRELENTPLLVKSIVQSFGKDVDSMENLIVYDSLCNTYDI